MALSVDLLRHSGRSYHSTSLPALHWRRLVDRIIDQDSRFQRCLGETAKPHLNSSTITLMGRVFSSHPRLANIALGSLVAVTTALSPVGSVSAFSDISPRPSNQGGPCDLTLTVSKGTRMFVMRDNGQRGPRRENIGEFNKRTEGVKGSGPSDLNGVDRQVYHICNGPTYRGPLGRGFVYANRVTVTDKPKPPPEPRPFTFDPYKVHGACTPPDPATGEIKCQHFDYSKIR